MTDGIMQAFKKVSGHFAFEFFIEVWNKRIIEALQEWLKGYTPEKMEQLARQGKFPDLQDLDFSVVRNYLEYLEDISAERLFVDFLIPARPDIAEALLNMSANKGVKWFQKLRDHLLDRVRGAVPAEADIVQAVCDNCGKSWPVPRSEFDSIKECPFCHTGKDEPSTEES
jgi:hypothetical protein